MLMHLNRQCDSYDDAYGRHEPWHTLCNGFWQSDFDFSADPLEYEGHHRRDKIDRWYTGLVIWNFATQLWDRVKIVERHEASMARYRTMSYPIDEDDETEWRQTVA
jgi:hypothetical protein